MSQTSQFDQPTQTYQRSAARTYSTGEAARVLGLGASTLQRAIIKNKLKAYKTPGGHFRVLEEDLITFANQQGLSWPPPTWEPEPRVKKILLVDDEPAYVRLMQSAFEGRQEFEIRTAVSGYEAGILTERFLPDVILLDVLLKDVDGREVCKLIKGTQTLRHIKVIGVTVLSSETDVQEMINAGMDDYLHKPFTDDELIGKVEGCLKRLIR